MILFFRSKAGVVMVSLLAFGLFFGLSKLRQRSAKRDHANVLKTDKVSVTPTEGANEAAMLKRAQESAAGKGDTAREEKENPSNRGESFDITGNAYRRRQTPEPIQGHMVTQPGNGSGKPTTTEPPEQIIMPSLRIRGRQPDARPEQEHEAAATQAQAGQPPKAAPRVKPTRFVPYGRLIKAELVITIESTSEEMPLIGLITEPVYNNGHLVIPAGTEVHSTAKADRIRNRIISGSMWKLIFPREANRVNGRQLSFNGVALDREDRDGNGLTWGIEDGSYGLKGREIRSGQTQKEIMLFAAEALKAASASLMDTHQTILGNSIDATPKNAAMAGGQAVLDNFAKEITEELKRNGVYIQVPAGKTFYVYPRQVIDPDRADIPDDIAKVE